MMLNLFSEELEQLLASLQMSREEGKIEGKAEGLADGSEKAINETVINLYNNGGDINIISLSTGLSIDKINELVNSPLNNDN